MRGGLREVGYARWYESPSEMFHSLIFFFSPFSNQPGINVESDMSN